MQAQPNALSLLPKPIIIYHNYFRHDRLFIIIIMIIIIGLSLHNIAEQKIKER
jgi:ABC-type nitrate/sulfonate/bicarbonate transport system permease component